MGLGHMQTCVECSKVYVDLRDIEECDACYAFICHKCVVEDDMSLLTYCSEECRDSGE